MDPDRLVVYAAITGTSGAALVVGARALGLPWTALAHAGARGLEVFGLAVLFFVTNIVAGTTFIIGMRLVGGVFISVYTMDDLVLPVLSAAQALVFHLWQGRADR
ncbi:MAG TPA: hypothetical protein VMR23_13795 [Candidatus Limnocylindria bacterium]|nr:hypothetical protein [Candidatus Limnocylindria bacterium]